VVVSAWKTRRTNRGRMPAEPRLIHLLWNGEIGGAERAVLQLAYHQNARGLNVALGFGQAAGPHSDAARALGLSVVDFALASGHDINGVKRSLRLLSEFDVHHFHCAEPVLMVASILCPRATRLYTHRGSAMRYDGRRAWRYRLVAPLLRHCFAAITGSRQAACAAERVFGLSTDRVFHTENGVDPRFLDATKDSHDVRQRFGIDRNAVVVGTAARLLPSKRIDWLIEAVGRLEPGGWKLVILGDGPERHRLEALAERSASASILFTGMQPNIGDWLRALDVFALPSGPEESFGNAVVEAMASGLPVIVCSDSPAHVQHVRDGQTGCVVEGVDDLATTLAQLISQPALRARLGSTARTWTLATYSMERMVDRYDELYALVESRGG
jgi:glycosyltransferase involved in cell wall biosynthesis